MTLEEQIRAQGGNWSIGGIDRAAELADLLRAKGVTSLDGLSLTGDYQQSRGSMVNPRTGESLGGGREAFAGENTRQLKIGDKTVGFLGDYNLDGTYGSKSADYLREGSQIGWSARGDGNVGYNVQTGPDGKVSIVPTWASSSDAERIKYPLMGLAAFTGAGLLANSMGAAGAAGAATGGISAADAAAALGGVADAGAVGGAAVAAPSAGAFGAGLGAETAAGLVAPGAAGGGGALLAAPGAAGAAAGAGALASIPSWLPEAVGPAWNFIKDNPKLVGALAGGLLGGVGAKADDEPAPYGGPMPMITRGGWQADARGGYKPMQAQQYGSGGLLATPGQRQPASGLHRYMGLLGG